MIDYGYRKALSLKTDKELSSIVEKEWRIFSKNALLDAQNILFERGVSFEALYPAEINKDPANETPSNLDNTIWKIAYEQKLKGKSNLEIHELLTSRGVDAYQISLALKRLPKINDLDDDFANLIVSEYRNSISHTIFTYVILIIIVVSLILIDFDFNNLRPAYLIAGSFVFIVVFFKAYTNTGGFSGSNYWITMLRDNPGNIIWVKPIVEKMTVAHIITLSENMSFELLTQSGRRLILSCNKTDKRQLLIKGIRESLPHAQFGYSNEILKMYNSVPATKFIDSLKLNGLYTPIDMCVVI